MEQPAGDNLSLEIAKRRQMTALWMDAQPRILAFILSAVPRIHDAEDLVQQVAIDMATNFEVYDTERPFVSWAIGIARNRVREYLRSARTDRLIFSDAVIDALAAVHAEPHPEIRPELEALQHCLGKLEEKSRHILHLRYTDRLGAPDIADHIGSTSGYVRVLLKRIRDRLAACIQNRIVTNRVMSGSPRHARGGEA